MENLVFLTSQSVEAEPYTTSDVIAEYSQVDRRSVNKMITTYKDNLEDFGVLRFQIAKPLKGSKGGRPRKIYHLNEQQATTLITYLDNTKPVREFKKALVKSFYNQRDELTKLKISYEQGKVVSKDLGDAINDSSLPKDNFIYSNINKLIYKQALGVNTSQLKKARNIGANDSISKFLTVEERQAVNKVKNLIIALLGLDYNYQEIKGTLENKGIIYQTTLTIPVKV